MTARDPVLFFLIFACALLAAGAPPLANEDGAPVTTAHGLALYGDLKYGPGFEHFDYVNPDAPKGGTFRYGWSNTFDNLNPFIVAGSAPNQNLEFLVYETLMRRSGDEPTSVYGLIAESIAYPDDWTWVEFTLRDGARWHDGRPITVADVIFSLDLMKNEASPQYRANFAEILAAEQTGPRTVRFELAKGSDRGTAHAAAQLTIFPRHYWESRDFGKPSIELPLGSGPYRIERVDPGRTIVFERVRDHWAEGLPINRGLYNFDRIRHEYYRDIAILHEALLAGTLDLRWETLPTQWATGYDTPQVAEGRLIKELIPYSGTTMYAGYYFNLRKPLFQDRTLRRAIAAAFDFSWINRMIFHGLYLRLQSHFENSELAAKGLPSAAELELLEPWRDQLPPELFTRAFHSPQTDGTRASLRENLRNAMRELNEAGYRIVDGKLMTPDGQAVTIEIIGWDPFFERVTGPFVANLALIGIDARQRTIDTAQYFSRLQNFEFDVTVSFNFPQSMSPGAEQREFWGSEMANVPGTRNIMGIQDPVVDALIEKIIAAPDREAKVAATRALDRVLLWNSYSIPHYYAPGIPVVYWNKFGRPATEPRWVKLIWHMTNWWYDPARADAVARGEDMSDWVSGK
jgi:microcin C transport system substrate-binding protein